MNQWRDLEEKIINIAEKETLPKSLSPEAIEKQLKAKEAECRRRQNQKSIRYLRWAGMATAFVLVLTLWSSLLGEEETLDQERPKIEEYVENEEDLTEKIPGAESYDMVYAKIQEIQKNKKREYYDLSEEMNMSAQAELSDGIESNTFTGTIKVTNSTKTKQEDVKGDSYSKTNLQEEGVGEADVVITDGNYLYIQRENSSKIAIVKVENEQMETVSEISIGENQEEKEIYLHEFYVNLDKLYLLATRYQMQNNKATEETLTITYDISDRSNPKEIGSLSQSGSYYSSRMTSGYLYVFSDHVIYEEVTKDNPGSYVPLVQGKAVACSDICIPENTDDCQYKVITSIQLENPTAFTEEQVVLCGNGMVYVSQNHIYFTSYDFGNEDQEYGQTEIWKFTYQDGKIVGNATGTVKGRIRDQFAFSESKGFLRVVTTYKKKEETTKTDGDFVLELTGEDRVLTDMIVNNTENQKNGLYVLDSQLSQVGALEDLAQGEQVYAARFFTDTAYFVTFRQTDPLFSVDLSDPANPKLLGELKIPGFSEYLHPYGDGLLLGIGYDTDEDGRQTGIKLSMFDISDPANVKEAATKVITEYGDHRWASSDAMYDYKSVLVDVEKNLIGFQLQESQEQYGGGYSLEENNQYVVYGYDSQNGFYEKMRDGYLIISGDRTTEEQKEINEKMWGNIRGVYIGQYLYGIHRNYEIRCYDMNQGYQLLSQYEF